MIYFVAFILLLVLIFVNIQVDDSSSTEAKGGMLNDTVEYHYFAGSTRHSDNFVTLKFLYSGHYDVTFGKHNCKGNPPKNFSIDVTDTPFTKTIHQRHLPEKLVITITSRGVSDSLDWRTTEEIMAEEMNQ